MAVAVPPSLNGRPRKQLSDQLDRLDEVINGMEEFLPQAVADATRDGIRQAFRDVVSELVTDPLVLEKLRASLLPNVAPPSQTVKPTAFARLKAIVRGAAVKVVTVYNVTKSAISNTRQRVTEGVAGRCATAKNRLACWTLLSLPLKSILAVSLAFGFVVAIVSMFAPHHIAAALSGIGASLTAMAVQVGNWIRRRRTLLV